MPYNTNMHASRKTLYRKAAEYLRAADPVLAPLVDRFGLCTIQPHTDYYGALAGSIISQQLSVKAADTIERRFCQLFGGNRLPSPEQILTKDIDALRSAGLSRGKATYIRDLAKHIVDGKVRFDTIQTQSNDAIIAELTEVKGIGEWTAHMFLMFCMGRLDVLAPGDLGVRNAIRNLYGFADAPAPKEVIALAGAHGWAPYQTVACWYLWQSLDNTPSL